MAATPGEPQPTVIIIEDDRDVREALQGLFKSVGMAVEPFESVQAYIEGDVPDRLGCMVLDVRLPGKSGLEFQEDLVRDKISTPIVFISGHADVKMSVRAMKAGAVEFLTKPVRDQDLLEAVQLAIGRDWQRRQAVSTSERLRRDYATLTARERQVMALIVIGRRNREIALDIGITEATVKLHRAHIMQKLQTRSLVEIVRIADVLDQRDPPSSTKG